VACYIGADFPRITVKSGITPDSTKIRRLNVWFFRETNLNAFDLAAEAT
jgi:hypothetical protein